MMIIVSYQNKDALLPTLAVPLSSMYIINMMAQRLCCGIKHIQCVVHMHNKKDTPIHQ